MITDTRAPRHRSLGATLLVILTTLVAAFATFVAGGSNSFELLPLRLVYDGIAALALIPWLAGGVAIPTWRPASRLLPAIGVCLAVFTISTITSRVPRLSVEMLGYAVLIAAMYLLLVAMMRRPILRAHLERLGLTLCLAVCVIYLIQVAQEWLDWWALLGHLAVPPLRPGYVGVLFPDPLATVALVLGAFDLATLPGGGRRMTLLRLAVGILILVTVFLTGSRGAWLGLALGAIAAGSAALFAERDLRSVLGRVLRSGTGALALLVVLAAAAAALALAAHSGRFTIGDEGSREAFWAASFRMFEASPLTGIGPGVWGTLRATFALPAEFDYYIPHAHDIFIQALAEFGLLAIPATVAVFANLGQLTIRSFQAAAPEHRRVAYAAIFSVVLLAGQQLVDVLVNVPAVLLAIALPVAWLDAVALGPPQPQVRQATTARGRGHLLAAASTAAVVVVLAGIVRVESAAGMALTGTARANGGAWADAETAYAKAGAADPDVAAYRFELGLAAANAGDLPTAEQALAASAAVDDYTYAWLDLAAVRWRAGDAPGARSALVEAERLGWQRPDVALPAGWLREQLGDRSGAIEDYGAALASEPTLAADPFWQAGERRPEWTAILGAADRVAAAGLGHFGDAAQTRLAVALFAGRADAARTIAANLDPDQRRLYDLVIPAWAGDGTARTTLSAMATSSANVSAQSWSAILAERSGDLETMAKMRSLLTIDATAATGGGVSSLIIVVFDPSSPGIRSGLERYGSVYRRVLPDAKVVGILPQVTPLHAP